MGLTEQVLDVLEQLAPVQTYEVGILVQLAVSVDDSPAYIADGLAVSRQAPVSPFGAGAETLTVALT